MNHTEFQSFSQAIEELQKNVVDQVQRYAEWSKAGKPENWQPSKDGEYRFFGEDAQTYVDSWSDQIKTYRTLRRGVEINPYDVLGIDTTASAEEIEHVVKKLRAQRSKSAGIYKAFVIAQNTLIDKATENGEVPNYWPLAINYISLWKENDMLFIIDRAYRDISKKLHLPALTS